MRKENLFVKIANYAAIYLFFLFIVFYYANNINLERHWSSFTDQEVTLAYNALLFNSGALQEYNDHPGYFTIFFLSIFLKFINGIGYLSTYNFSILDSNHNLDADLQNIIYYTRIFSSICVSFFLLSVFFLIDLFAKNKFFSLLLCVVVVFSIGTVVAMSQLRTELFAMMFFLLSLLNLCLFFKATHKYKIYNLILFFIFLFCSILNKSQTFFYLPCILLLSYFSYPEINISNLNLNKNSFLKRSEIKYFLFFIIFYYIFYKNFNFEQPKSKLILNIIFLTLNVFLINIFFYICLKKNNFKIYENLMIINLIMIVVFFLFKNILFLHPSTNEESFKTSFTNIMNIAVYIKNLSPDRNTDIYAAMQKILFFNLPDILRNLIGKITSINYYSYLIALNILLNYFFRKYLKKNNIIFNISCIFVFFYISTINEFRTAIQYSIYSDFFLALSFANFGNSIKGNKIILVGALILLATFLNRNDIINYTNSIKMNNINSLCADTYFNDWHKKISKKDFDGFCKKYK